MGQYHFGIKIDVQSNGIEYDPEITYNIEPNGLTAVPRHFNEERIMGLKQLSIHMETLEAVQHKMGT